MGKHIKYKYQLILLGKDCSFKDTVEEEFRKICCSTFKIKDDLISVKRDIGHINNRNLICCVYFCSADAEEKEDERLNVLIRYSIPIIPVVIADRVSNISRCLPTNISGYNAICSYFPTSKKELMDSILVYFGLIREKRKIFISYSRNDSSNVAMQLFLEFSKIGYSVFLDIVSVGKGADIQEKIFHEMTDSDLVIMLDTIGYNKSEWCRLEYLKAMACRIGLFAVIWPGSNPPKDESWQLIRQYALRKESFIRNGELKKYDVRRIVHDVEMYRIANLAARKHLLINEFMNSERKKGNHAEYRMVENVIDSNGRLFIPVIGVPDSLAFNKARKKWKNIALLYSSSMISPDWIDYLDWINRFNFPIKTYGYPQEKDI